MPNLTAVGSLRIATYEGNTRTFVFRLRKKGTRQPLDSSAADSFKFEVERRDANASPANVIFTPITVLDTDPGADFATSVIPVTVGPSGPDITKLKGSLIFSLTQVVGTTETTLATGQLEIMERPGFNPPP